MAKNVINNNGPVTNNKTTNKFVSKTTNIEPRKNYGRGFLSGLQETNNWFGGIIESLTSRGVFGFFFLAIFIICFLRIIFINDPSFHLEHFIALLDGMPRVNFDWIESAFNWLPNIQEPYQRAMVDGWQSIGDIIRWGFDCLAYFIFMPVKGIFYLLSGLADFVVVGYYFIYWFFLPLSV